MILRTPPAKKRAADSAADTSSHPIVIYDFDSASPQSDHHQHPDSSSPFLCTYQCRQMVKSEFFEALSSAEKDARDYKTRFEELKKELSEREAERNMFKERLYISEQNLAAATAHKQALQEQILKEVADSHERYRAVLEHSKQLEVKLKKESNGRKAAEAAAATAAEKVKSLEETLKKVSESAGRGKSLLHQELLQLQTESSLSTTRLKADLERMECRASNAEKESELLKNQLEELRVRLNEQKNESKQNLPSHSSSHESSSSDTDILVKHLREELRNYEAEVQETKKLKLSHVNNALMNEKLLEEQRRRELAEKELLEFKAIQLDAKKLEDELISWRSILDDVPDITCRDDVPKKLASLEQEVIECMLHAGKVNARVKELEVALEASDLDKKHAQMEARLAVDKVEKVELEIKKLKLMLSTITEERDRLRKQTGTPKKGGGENGAGRDEAIVKEAETSFSVRESSLIELEYNLHEQRELINRQCHEIELLNEKLNFEVKKIKSLERESDRLRAEISLLESKLGHGDYSAANTKVLRMVNTLTLDDEVKHTIEVLQNELQKARSKLQAVEDLKCQSDAGNIIDSQVPEKLAQLKAQIATLEKREERYKTVFAEKISVFRRACCSLFGYKIEMGDHQRPNGINVPHFTLKSIYANTDEEKLEFEYESGNANILVNDYTMQPEISQQVDIFIRKMNSIPAFTANLTVESFNRRTLC